MEEKENVKKNNPVYSEIAYDDAFRTMEGRCDDLVISFVSHMFGENYGKDAVIKRLWNEHFVEHMDGSEEKRVTDSSFEIIYREISKRYHIECESLKYDGTILVRIFEYGSQIAKNSAEETISSLKVSFPNSGLLLLRGSDKASDKANIEITVPGGKTVSYDVPIVKMSDYTVEDIFREKLYMLIPFYIFNYENQLPEIDKSEDAINKLFDEYNYIFNRLKKELEMGSLSALSYSAIIKLTHSVAYKLTMKQDNVQKKVGDFMGGKIIDLPEFQIFDQGVEKGKAESEEEGIRIFIEDKVEDSFSEEDIIAKLQKHYKLSKEKAKEYYDMYSGKLAVTK
ncbi:hypothetical protein [Butyrivibrio sp. AE3004]|uniref:hypothetical protein n=1 Tax=Butyrivibrio sp. AE3004 TaxID=1506994 RepID=UPI000689F287|nr:hypothetical protein [Butyrivibrio sp. AE3004]